jgi:phosphoenolpyruvate carboxylase
VVRLGARLSQSDRHVKVPQALLDGLAADAQAMPAVAAAQGPRTEGEPWRRKLRFVEARLEATLALGEQRRLAPPERTERMEPPRAPPYRQPSELQADLELCADTLEEANAERSGARQVKRLLARVKALGFMAAELEMRVLAEDVRAAWSALEQQQEPATPGGKRVVDSLRRLATLREELGDRACRTLILSMAKSSEDVLAAFQAAKACGLWDDARGAASVNVVPLFETLGALDAAPTILTELFAHPAYLAHVQGRGAQEVMVGYSDSGKEVGLLAASAALYRAQSALPPIAREAGIRLRIFHGRGESVARGGGPAQQGILALPPGSVNGSYKATEQGEALDHKYARPELAKRTLELIAGGALLHSLDAQERPSEDDERRYLAAYDALAALGRTAYRALVWDDPRFEAFFRAVTPVEEIAELPMGSRPSKRGQGGLSALRAIPWVFAWTQNRAILPGWYGVGTALQTFRETQDGVLLIEMYRHWPYFHAVLDNVEMVLAKSDLAIAERYAALAPAELHPLWDLISEEHHRTRAAIQWVTGHRKLLEENPALARSISLRNPYVDPMSFLQVELLRRKRAGESLDRPLLLTLSGIASGMRNTG